MLLDSYHALIKDPEGDAPIIFAFHGTGGDEHQFFEFTQRVRPGAGVVSPRGDVTEKGASRFFKRTGEGVYDMKDLARATSKMSRFVADIKAQDSTRLVFGFGYSNGANILASVMIEAPELFDRVGLLHPLIPWSPSPVPGLKGTRVLITAGHHDPICPWQKTQELTAWIEDQGAKITTHFHEGGHEMREEETSALADLLHHDTS